jgi:hypothetical protein
VFEVIEVEFDELASLIGIVRVIYDAIGLAVTKIFGNDSYLFESRVILMRLSGLSSLTDPGPSKVLIRCAQIVIIA